MVQPEDTLRFAEPAGGRPVIETYTLEKAPRCVDANVEPAAGSSAPRRPCEAGQWREAEVRDEPSQLSLHEIAALEGTFRKPEK